MICSNFYFKRKTLAAGEFSRDRKKPGETATLAQEPGTEGIIAVWEPWDFMKQLDFSYFVDSHVGKLLL